MKKSNINLCESVLDDQMYFNMDHFSNHKYSKQRWPIKKNIKDQCKQVDCIDD